MKRRKLDEVATTTSDAHSSYQDGSSSDENEDGLPYHTPETLSKDRAGTSRSSAKASPLSKTKSYTCLYPGCTKSYTKPSRLAEHERRPFKCHESGCKASFRREDHLATHQKSQHGGPRDFVCPQPGCTSAFHSQDKLTRHFKTHAELADPQLATTAFSLSAPPSPTSSHQRHARTRSSSLTGSIAPLNLTDDDDDDDDDDENDITGQHQQHQQQQRRQMSVDPEAPDRLAEVIRRTRPYACAWEGCLKRFTKHQKLKAHVCMVHEGRKPYPCLADGCDKSFQTPSKLRKHSLQHTEAKRYACAYLGCGEYFTKWSLLQKHTKISHKTTQCDVCGKAILKKNLSAHIKIHDTSRPEVPCTVEGCRKVFSTERTLATHIKTAHIVSSEATAQFKCDYKSCEQAFSFKHVLERHIRNIHTNLKKTKKKRGDTLEFDVIDALAGFAEDDVSTKLPYACQIPGCNRRYSTEVLLKRHLKSRMHKTGEVTGLQVLQAMDQDENRAIQDMIALHLDTGSSNNRKTSNNTSNS
ncbi:hypothetical protein BGX33_000787 [Mortierella sp. NVP41]|nr:hypothetical protein BGX33_000787 [Mortierella sp. NVP41]